MRDITLAQLRGENALTIVGTVAGLLKKVDREVGTSYADEYRAKALSGDYANVCAVTEEYAVQFLATTLQAQKGDLTDDEGAEETEAWEEELV